MVERQIFSSKSVTESPFVSSGVLKCLHTEYATELTHELELIGVKKQTIIDLANTSSIKSGLGLINFRHGKKRSMDYWEDIDVDANSQVIKALLESSLPYEEANSLITNFTKSVEARQAFVSADSPQEIINSYLEYGAPPRRTMK